MALLQVLIGAGAAAAGSLVGVHLTLAHPRFSARAARPFVALAGGIVLGAVFLHLLPEALVLAPRRAWLGVVAAFLCLYLIESHTLPHVHGPHSGDEPEPQPPHVHLGHFAALGFGAHALFDGLAIGAGSRGGSGLATSTLLAVLAHKVPEGMALLSLLVQGGFSERRALRWARVVAVATPVGALASYSALGEGLAPASQGIVLSCIAGSFLYISACDLLPEVRRHPSLGESALIIGGVGIMWLLTAL